MPPQQTTWGGQGTWKEVHGGCTKYAHYVSFSFYFTDFDSNTQHIENAPSTPPQLPPCFSGMAVPAEHPKHVCFGCSAVNVTSYAAEHLKLAHMGEV